LAAALSQEDLADRAGISRNYVSLLELNRKSPTVAVLFDVCEALGISASDIVRRVEGSPGRSGRTRRRP